MHSFIIWKEIFWSCTFTITFAVFFILIHLRVEAFCLSSGILKRVKVFSMLSFFSTNIKFIFQPSENLWCVFFLWRMIFSSNFHFLAIFSSVSFMIFKIQGISLLLTKVFSSPSDYVLYDYLKCSLTSTFYFFRKSGQNLFAPKFFSFKKKSFDDYYFTNFSRQ